MLSPPAPRYPQILFISPDGGSGYQIDFPRDAQGRPKADTRTVPSGPYEGLVGLITPYTATVTARTTTKSEVRMQRTLQTVAVPVFQFGIFSDTDLSFHAGPDFNFGGCPKLCPRQLTRNQAQPSAAKIERNLQLSLDGKRIRSRAGDLSAPRIFSQVYNPARAAHSCDFERPES